MAEKGIETLQLWQKAIKFAAWICQDILPVIPIEEKWALSPQLRRAVQSVPANIAEGFGRYYYQESVRFCYIARGSLEEAFSHLVLAKTLGYLDATVWVRIESDINELRRLLSGYISYLKRCKRGEYEPGSDIQVRENEFIYSSDLPVGDISDV